MSSRSPQITVMVCHDCCCGTEAKHPGIDHFAQREALLDLASDTVRVQIVDCLDVCERSSVVLVRDHGKPRRDRDTWLAKVDDPAQIQAIEGWVGQGSFDVPQSLADHVFTPGRKHKAP